MKWEVCTKGSPSTRVWEVSVVREGNSTGKVSFDRWGSEKVMIAKSNGFLCDEGLWESYKVLADNHAKYLTEKEEKENDLQNSNAQNVSGSNAEQKKDDKKVKTNEKI